MLRTCVLTVLGETDSSPAISGRDRFVGRYRSTLSSPAFAVIEVRSTHALLPIRVLRSRDRTGSYLISLCVGAALFGMFFFLTIFVQNV